MIAINQVKSEIPWNGHRLQIRDMIDSEEVLRKKAAADSESGNHKAFSGCT